MDIAHHKQRLDTTTSVVWGMGVPQNVEVAQFVYSAKKTNRPSLPTSIWSGETASQVWEGMDTISQVKIDHFWSPVWV